MADETATYRCKNCGGEVRFNVKEQRFMCEACKAEYAPELENDTVTVKDFNIQKMLVSSAELSGVKTARCESCGGEIFFDDKETAARCPMCGSAQIRQNAAKVIITPDGIVPFAVDANDAQQSFRKFISKRFFAPSALKNAFEEGKLEGWYMPFWTFDADANAAYTGEGSKSVKVMKDGKETTETKWFPVRGRVEKSFNDVLVCAAGNNSRKMTDRLTDYDTSAVKPYSSQYLWGYLAEYRSVEAGDAFERAKYLMDEKLEQEANSEIRENYSSARGTKVKSVFSNVTCKNIMLPLYRASYSYSGKLYDYIINGQTGTVSANYPKSAIKIILTILAVAAVIAGIVLLTKLR